MYIFFAFFSRCDDALFRPHNTQHAFVQHPNTTNPFTCSGDPLFVGMDLTIASFDAISEVNMVSF